MFNRFRFSSKSSFCRVYFWAKDRNLIVSAIEINENICKMMLSYYSISNVQTTQVPSITSIFHLHIGHVIG